MISPRTASLSIIVPCYNDGRFLTRSIGSVINQLTPDDEIIVVDDGSTDGCHTIAEQYRDKCAQVTLLRHQTNSGVAQARNTGLAAARGDYIIFLDADDELTPDALTHYRRAIKASQPDWIIGGHIWQTGARRDVRIPKVGQPRNNFRRFIDKKLHLGNLSCMCFFRTHASSGFPTHLRVGEDHVFLAVLLANSQPHIVPKLCAEVHRRNSGSLRTSANKGDLLTSMVNATLFSHPKLPPNMQKFRQLADKRHYLSIMRFAWKHRDVSLYCATYFEAIKRYPRLICRAKWTYRRLLLCQNTREERKAFD